MRKKFLSNKDESVRLFDNDYLEALTKVHPVTPLVVFVPVITYFIFRSFTFVPKVGAGQILGLFILGLLMWSFIEYAIHRFVFHLTFQSERLKRFHFLFHGIHHDYPQDSRRLVMPPSVSIPLSTLIYFSFSVFLAPAQLPPFFAGFIVGYLAYDMSHFAIHHIHFRGKIWQAIKVNHMKHHYLDHDHGYGVSSPLWDVLLNTRFISADAREFEKVSESSRF